MNKERSHLCALQKNKAERDLGNRYSCCKALLYFSWQFYPLDIWKFRARKKGGKRCSSAGIMYVCNEALCIQIPWERSKKRRGTGWLGWWSSSTSGRPLMLQRFKVCRQQSFPWASFSIFHISSFETTPVYSKDSLLFLWFRLSQVCMMKKRKTDRKTTRQNT